MSTKKRSKPLFEVPSDVQASPESGWVYRSTSPPAETPKQSEDPGRSPSTDGVLDAATLSVTYGLQAITRLLVLGVRLATLPLTAGMRVFQAVIK